MGNKDGGSTPVHALEINVEFVIVTDVEWTVAAMAARIVAMACNCIGPLVPLQSLPETAVGCSDPPVKLRREGTRALLAQRVKSVRDTEGTRMLP